MFTVSFSTLTFSFFFSVCSKVNHQGLLKCKCFLLELSVNCWISANKINVFNIKFKIYFTIIWTISRGKKIVLYFYLVKFLPKFKVKHWIFHELTWLMSERVKWQRKENIKAKFLNNLIECRKKSSQRK